MKKEISFFNKVKFILRGNNNKIIFIGILLFIGMLFEMASIGIIIPMLTILLDSNFVSNNPELFTIFRDIGLNSHNQIIAFLLYLMLTIYLLKTLFMTYLSWKQAFFSAEISSSTSAKIYSIYLNQKYSFHLSRNSNELTRNIIGEAHEFSELLKSIIVLSIELVAVIGIATVLLIQEPFGSIIIFFFILFFSLIMQVLTKKKLLKWGSIRQQHDGLMKKKLAHGLLGIKNIKLKANESFFLNEFNFHNLKKVSVIAKQYALTFFPRLYLELLAVAGLVFYIIFSLNSSVKPELLLPTIGLFMAAAFRILPSANRIIGSFQYIRYSKPVVDIIYDEFNLINSNFYNPNLISKNILFNKKIELKDICYSYEGEESKENVLKKINLTINKGESIGIIGQSGSGKSTLIDILLGLLIPNSGSIELDGALVFENKLLWKSNVGYVPQSIFLSDDTIRKNIAFGVLEENIDSDDIERAIADAQLTDFINDLPAGINTIVGEQGVRLSGGQKQRIGLARALYYDPSLLILDEATSALDTQTEKLIMKTVFSLSDSKTIIIVAHRLSTLDNCTKIISLKNGTILKIGSPKELLK